MARHLLVVSLGVNLALASATWETVQIVPAKHPQDASIKEPDIVIAILILDDSNRFELILVPKI